MSEASTEARVALQLVATTLAMMTVKGMMSRDTLLHVFQAAALSFEIGSPEAEVLDRLQVQLMEMFPKD